MNDGTAVGGSMSSSDETSSPRGDREAEWEAEWEAEHGVGCRCARAAGPEESLWRVRDRLGLSIADLFLGAFVAWLVFSLLAGAELWWLDRGVGEAHPATYAGVSGIVLVHGFIPVMLVALAVGSLLALVMRRVAHQAWHLAAFGLAGAAILGVPMMIGGAGPWGPGVLAVTLAAIAGRGALWHRFTPPTAGQ